MKSNVKMVKLAAMAGLALIFAGCGGLNASRSVSPATFLLPGVFGQKQADSNFLLASQSEPDPVSGPIQPR